MLFGGLIREINSLGNSIFLDVTSTLLCSFGEDLIKNFNSFNLSKSASIFLNRVVNFLPLNPHVQQLYDWKWVDDSSKFTSSFNFDVYIRDNDTLCYL